MVFVKTRAGWFVALLLIIGASQVSAEASSTNILCRDDLSATQRDELTSKLREITGWPDLKFDLNGSLRIGLRDALGGSRSARALVRNVLYGPNVVVLENASKRPDVIFSRVVPGEWKSDIDAKPAVYVVLIDFADFEQVMGDNPALSAFNVGWGLLHELDHVAHDSADGTILGQQGSCEEHINLMRRECNLPQRADYFFTFFPLNNDDGFITRFVRLAFEQEDPIRKKKKRYWLIWDANLVGGINDSQQTAALR